LLLTANGDHLTLVKVATEARGSLEDVEELPKKKKVLLAQAD
jgi:hypothetical protein